MQNLQQTDTLEPSQAKSPIICHSHSLDSTTILLPHGVRWYYTSQRVRNCLYAIIIIPCFHLALYRSLPTHTFPRELFTSGIFSHTCPTYTYTCDPNSPPLCNSETEIWNYLLIVWLTSLLPHATIPNIYLYLYNSIITAIQSRPFILLLTVEEVGLFDLKAMLLYPFLGL